MSYSRLAPAVLALPFLAGCVIIADDGELSRSYVSSGPSSAGAGTVFGAEIQGDRVAFTVSSNGCTTRDFFEADVRERSGRHFVEIDRIRTDTCRALVPEGVEVSWSFAELGLADGADVELVNPVRRR